ncbi:hypothetical protein ACN6LC_002786 [Streptomyces violaceoruber]|uniref:Uncharacterized protein n=3 Tax=Streptomyces TaxID=1883 RepID=A0A7U9DV28_STRLI|nr:MULTISPECIES: hypothetical protein [Streptomyces]BDE39381.1 hypothetical protein SLITK23_26260 [Streptomyces lividans]EFD69282.1 predicted protein [Streptomyces lividans TK24]EOY47663.1 hypothetical protein SLI_2949 [Streptomyces lividans 1326]KKD13791.1 hypothetical protein TR66_19065 [Streptomyces sp. WM6391]MBQ0947770.1 hypothetical protein [Streptomyces sp. RK76]
MSEPLHRIADAVADVTESDAVAVLTALGLQKDRRQPAKKAPRTPLPPPAVPSDVSSDVEWV